MRKRKPSFILVKLSGGLGPAAPIITKLNVIVCLLLKWQAEFNQGKESLVALLGN